MKAMLWCFQENFQKEIALQENAQFSVCQADRTPAKVAVLENQQDIKVWMTNAVMFLCIWLSINIGVLIL